MSQNTLFDRALALAGGTALSIMPLAAATPAAQAVTLVHDYSLAGEYSSSGWFMTWLDDAAADAVTDGDVLKLFGAKTIDDGLFWAWSDYAQATVRRYDVTGMAFAWGGGIDGNLNPGDLISAPFDFTLDFTHTEPAFPAFDYTNVNWELKLGFRDQAYTPESWQSDPSGNSLTYTSAYGSVDVAGIYQFQDVLQVEAQNWGWTAPTDWFAVLTVNWSDPLARMGYEDTHGSLNGDTLTLTVPQQSIDLSIIPSYNVGSGNTFTNTGTHHNVVGKAIEIYGTFVNAAGAQVDNEGEVYVYWDGQFDNAGLVRNLVGANFSVEGTLNNQAGAALENWGSLAAFGGAMINNAGSVDLKADSGFDNEGSFNNLLGGVAGLRGTLNNRSGGEVNNAGTFNGMVGGILNNEGSFNNQLGGFFGLGGTFNNLPGGQINNAGMFKGLLGGVVNNEGGIQLQAGGSLDNAGTLRNLPNALLSGLGGSLIHNQAGGVVENEGTIQLSPGGKFINAGLLKGLGGGLLMNDGTLDNLLGGKVEEHGEFINNSSHTVNNDGEFHVHGGLENTETGVFNNTGLLAVHAGGWFYTEGTVNNTGVIVNAGDVEVGSLGSISGSGSYTQSDGSTWVQGLLSGDTIRFDAGYLAGDGTVAAGGSPIQLGEVAVYPGDMGLAGILTMEGGVQFGALTQLIMDVTGPVAGLDHDQLLVLGDILLDGDLIVELGYALAPGDVITLLTTSSGAVNGRFANAYVNGGIGFVSYGDQGVYLSLAAPVPEPETWAMLLAGLGVMGWRARRSRRLVRRA